MNKILRTQQIFKRLYQDYLFLTFKGYDVLGVFLQGSDNYNLSDDYFDIDIKAIIIPTLENLINGDKVSYTEILKDNSHLDVKDIRAMNACFLKQNINFLEILFTPYKILNPKYASLYSPVFIFNEEIAHYDKYKCMQTLLGDLRSKNKALTHKSPHNEKDIELYGYGLKDYHHIKRLEYFIPAYLKEYSYKACLELKWLTDEEREHLIYIKRNPVNNMSAEDIKKECESIVNKFEDLLLPLIEKEKEKEKKTWVVDFLNKIELDCISLSVKQLDIKKEDILSKYREII